MHRRKFRKFMRFFVIISVVVLVGLFFNNYKNKNQDDFVFQVTEGDSLNNNANSELYSFKDEDYLNFYINSNNVKKSIVAVGETTMFTLETKLFIKNRSFKNITFYNDALSINFNIEGKGLLFEITNSLKDSEAMIEANDSIAIDYVIKYIITDKENFNIFDKYDLNFSYINQSVLIEKV